MTDVKIVIKNCAEHEEDGRFIMVLYIGDKCPHCELLKKYYNQQGKLRMKDIDDIG